MSRKRNPVNWFEIPVTKMARAKAFYQHVLGLRLEEHRMGPMRMAWFPADQEAPGAAGSLMQSQDSKPSTGGVLVYFARPDLEATLRRAAKKGGRVLLPRTAIGEYGFIGVIRDTEGNRVGLHSMK
jgi:uncharacterized protein